MNTGNTKAKRTRRVLAGTFLLAAVLGTVLTFERTDNPEVSSEWPRPYDPAKPFNMLGVPGVSVEQRKRAEDLLVRSLQEASRWRDYQAAVDAGWTWTPLLQATFLSGLAASAKGSGASPDDSVLFEHLANPLLLNDGRMLDPEYPESLVYKVKNGVRTFVAYMYIAEPDISLDDPRIAGFAGRLIEWHDHSNLCWQYDHERRTSIFTGLKPADGPCPTDGGGSDVDFPTETPSVDFGSALMAHVWVVERICGPFSAVDLWSNRSALEGSLTVGVSTTPLDERVDRCEH